VVPSHWVAAGLVAVTAAAAVNCTSILGSIIPLRPAILATYAATTTDNLAVNVDPFSTEQGRCGATGPASIAAAVTKRLAMQALAPTPVSEFSAHLRASVEPWLPAETAEKWIVDVTLSSNLLSRFRATRAAKQHAVVM
jgi:hypothetical protein